MKFFEFLSEAMKKVPVEKQIGAGAESIQDFVRKHNPEGFQYPIFLDYPAYSTPRWTREKPNKFLYEKVNKNRAVYIENLENIKKHKKYFLSIPKYQKDILNEYDHYGINGWIPGLDTMALYTFIVPNDLNKYIEAESGNSTKFARRARSDHNLNAELISIDPFPRTEIK